MNIYIHSYDADAQSIMQNEGTLMLPTHYGNNHGVKIHFLQYFTFQSL